MTYPRVKRFENVVNCIEILSKPKSRSEGLTQLLGYLAYPISLCDSDVKTGNLPLKLEAPVKS
jgi:hypothetical protein